MNIERKVNKSPEESANVFSILFFWWSKDFFRKGAKGNLTLDDVYDPLKSNESGRLADKLEREWYRELDKLKDIEYTLGKDGNKKWRMQCMKPSLYKVILRVFWKKYLVIGIFVFIQIVILATLQPLIQGWIITYFNVTPSSKSITRKEAILYALGLILNIIASIIILHHTNLRNQEVGMQIRVACSSLIYRKILRLNKATLTQTTDTGQIINILSNDVSRFDQFTLYLHYLWITPIHVVLVTYVMWTMIGFPTFVGVISLILITLPVQGFFPLLSQRLRASIAILTDKRVQLMNEFINGIQVIKMYAWEKPLSKFVSETRRSEIKNIKLTSFIRITSIAIVVFTERLTLYLSMISFALMGKVLNAECTYILSTFFNLLQLTVALYFPYALIMNGETKVSMKRIEEFLLLDESIANKRAVKPKEKYADKNKEKMEKIGLKITEPRVESEKAASVELTRVSANWIPNTLPPTLCNVSMKVEAGNLCILLGQVGSGKSALLLTLLKELPIGAGTMTILENSLANAEAQLEQRYVTDNPNIRISYASQEPWLFVGTIRENILFSQPYDKKRYADVTRVCALNKDFQQLLQGDMTIVGEKGAMLSGGQKARINLARAIYKKAEIYLFDDPLSAVDSKVAKHLFQKCIAEYLHGKTRILATHQLQFLKSADVIVALDHGTVKMKGSYNELMQNNEEFVKMITRIKMDREQSKQKEEANDKPFGYYRESIRSRMSVKSNDSSITEPDFDNYEIADNDEQEETFSTTSIPWSMYIKLFRYGGSWFTLILLLIVTLLAQVATSGNDYWISYWTNLETLRKVGNESSHVAKRNGNGMMSNTFLSSFLPTDDTGLITTNSAIYVYTFCILSCIILVLMRSYFFIHVYMEASRNIHNAMFSNVLQAKIRFFNMNPSGRILNRFSKDVGAMDELLPKAMIETLQIVLVVIGIVAMEIVTNYWIIIPLIILGICMYIVRTVYVNTAQIIKRLEGVCKSPVYCHVNTTVSGLSTIRSSGKETEDLLRKEFDRLQDKHTGTWYLLLISSAVLGFLLDIFSCLFIVFITFYFILSYTDKTLGGDVGLAISQALIIINMLQYGVKQSVEMFNQMSSVERIFQYTDLPKETLLTTVNEPPPPTWPTRGRLVLNNVSMRYNQNAAPVLKNLTVTIEAGWKVGVVGRTGAGKSSLIGALFRLFADGLEGEIKIDGIDTSTIGLQDLRCRLSIIPQEPILFAASLRYNLDPFNQYDDATLWDVLKEVEFTDIGLDQKIVTNGDNLSVGQRQLICLARAILKKNRVIVLDEATANIDSHTDELIQRTLRTKFADCTVITIAHRLNTIIDSDRIIVMDAGQILEFDSPYELLRNNLNGLFAQMVKNTGRVMSKNLLQQAEIAYRRNNVELSRESYNENDSIISCKNEGYIL